MEACGRLKYQHLTELVKTKYGMEASADTKFQLFPRKCIISYEFLDSMENLYATKLP